MGEVGCSVKPSISQTLQTREFETQLIGSDKQFKKPVCGFKVRETIWVTRIVNSSDVGNFGIHRRG